MKKALVFSSVAAAIALLVSCQKDNLGNVKPVSGDAVEFSVSLGDDTRTTIDGQFKTFWEKGDKLSVFDGSATGVATIPEEADGQASAKISAEGVSSEAESYTIIYPAKDEYFFEGGSVEAMFFPEQSGKFGDAQMVIGYAAAADSDIKLANVSSVISFETADADVTSVDFTALNEDDEFPIEATLAKVKGSKDQDSTAINITNTASSIKVKTNGAGKYYAAFFPFEQPIAGFKITVNKGDLSKEINVEVPVTFAAGKMISLGSIDGRDGKTYRSVEKRGFKVVSGDIDAEGNFSFETFKGGAGTDPFLASGDILRLYQKGSGKDFGGYIEITSKGGDKIAGVHMDIDNNTNIAWALDGGEFDASTATAVKKATGVNISGLNNSKVAIYCVDGSSSNRLNIKSIKVTYIPDARLKQDLSFPADSYDATVGDTFNAPVLSGVQTTVTYSSSDEGVATVDAATGAITLVAGGSCTITAKAAENDTYKEGTASYTLNVFTAIEGIKGIKALIREAAAGTEVSFRGTVTDMVATFSRTDAYPYVAYLEDAEGQAVYFYRTVAGSNPFAVGDKYNGLISGKGKVYNGCVEITEIDLSKATKSTGATVPLTTVTIAELNAKYADYEYRNVKIEGATVKTALTSTTRSCTIAQGDDEIVLYTGVSGAATADKDAVIDVVCHPDYYTKNGVTTYQCYIWGQDAITVKGGANVVTMDAEHAMQVGQNWTIGATAAQGGAITYSIVSGSDCGSISGGVFTATKAGTVVIKATSEAVSGYTAGEATATVTITNQGATTITLTFPDDNSENNKVNGYGDTWFAKSGAYQFKIIGFNNYKWDGWTYIKCGQKKDMLGVGTIETSSALSAKIASVTVTIDKFTNDKVKSFKLYVSSNADYSGATEYSTTIAQGDNKFTIASPAENRYYKIVIDCTGAGANGVVQLSKVVLSE